jgi:hypothetical protein
MNGAGCPDGQGAAVFSGAGHTEGLAPVEFMHPFQLVMNGDKLVADMGRVFDAAEIIQHGFNLSLASDQNPALRRSWFVGHGGLALGNRP